jgi:hypothetical protein
MPNPTQEPSEAKAQGVRVAKPPPAASEAQPHKMTKPTKPALSAGMAGHRVSDGT